ncbi:RluA family pseudouridine synthase [Cohnella algarum]|uniref:RluA family pseudouridine synthase n=1 Tax=Cohnella algarum TaxID=2044859 RepID=UPI00196779D3|nr:RluA family pseudouridine synthase [Cohnella algarum]MBN2979889.1 RluA family pseudouridine synthase [Cohnella algarum]
MHESADRYYPPIVHVALPADEGRTLRDVLKLRLGISRKLYVRLKTSEDGLKINGQPARPHDKIAAGDKIEVRMAEETSEDILPQPMELDIVFEDEHLLVLNKPAGVIVHPTTGHYMNTLANGVMHYWRERGERCRFRPVHRLDEHTSGLVIVAKHPYAHQQLSEQMIEGTVEKEYLAFVYGKPPLEAGEVRGPIGRVPEDPHRRAIRDDGAPSLTYYALARHFACGASELAIRLGTGRTHQIRVHMTSIGCPLIGDSYYTDPAWERSALSRLLDRAAQRQALHARLLGFRHPVTKEAMTLEAALPRDLEALAARLAELPELPWPGSSQASGENGGRHR